jgi:two-component system sensor histidine kinase EvgS
MEKSVKELLNIIEKNDFSQKVAFENEDLQSIYRLIRRTFKMNNILEKNLHSMNENLKQKVSEEIERNRQKEQMLLQQSKLAIMGEMLSMIAHQWRQPLSSIKMVSQSIKLKKDLGLLNDELIDKSIEDIVRLSDYMNSTIEDFRNFFKPSKEAEISSLSEFLDMSKSFLIHSFETTGIKMVTNYEQDAQVRLYRGEFTQVIINILNNAKDALVSKKVKDATVTIETVRLKEDKIRISISDNAGGIEDNILCKIFEPYFSTKGKNGTGLGLYMSKIIIDEHLEGLLSAENTKNGAVFYIDLPIYKEVKE